MKEWRLHRHCIRQASAHIARPAERMEVRRVDGSTEMRELIPMDHGALRAYLSHYSHIYQEIRGKLPEVVYVRRYAITSTEEVKSERPFALLLHDCKIHTSSVSTAAAIDVRALIRCDIETTNPQAPIRAEKIIDCVFRSSCMIAHIPGRQNAIVITRSAFQDRLVCQHYCQIQHSTLKDISFTTAKTVMISCHIDYLLSQQLSDIRLADCHITKSDFSGANFSGRAILDNVTFATSPLCAGINFSSKNVDFRRVVFDDQSSGEAIGTFRQLKGACSNAEYEAGVIFFHGLELQTHYNLHLARHCRRQDFPEKISSLFHRATTNYGRDTLRPFLMLFLLFALVAELYFLFLTYSTPQFLLQNVQHATLCSLRNSLGPLVFALQDSKEFCKEVIRDALSTEAVIAFFHIVLSSLLWFLIVFMIRRRFKL